MQKYQEIEVCILSLYSENKFVVLKIVLKIFLKRKLQFQKRPDWNF